VFSAVRNSKDFFQRLYFNRRPLPVPSEAALKIVLLLFIFVWPAVCAKKMAARREKKCFERRHCCVQSPGFPFRSRRKMYTAPAESLCAMMMMMRTASSFTGAALPFNPKLLVIRARTSLFCEPRQFFDFIARRAEQREKRFRRWQEKMA
jgi:hypothetical protein